VRLIRGEIPFKVLFSCFLAWMLVLMPLPEKLKWIRPEWVTLVLIYWTFKKPKMVGLFTGWWVGLIMDILQGTLLGQHALAMVLVVYFAHKLHHRLRAFTPLQQALVVLVLVGIGQLCLALVQWQIGSPPKGMLYWGSTLTSVLIWPVLSHFLNYYERKAH